ncbi:hypothetical protein [Patulibacter sp. SYSU D01012]|uniref:hypothetical protein n=1 Tax=Patulibacter sp. SYSU D01012 TaxID=2817381 RepID=UPI001B3047F4|nr:hypothetical protein [Patulibacter sp. SYSU D01012]
MRPSRPAPSRTAALVAAGAALLVAAAGGGAAPARAASITTTADVAARLAPGPAPTARRPRAVTLDVSLAWGWDADVGVPRQTLQRLVMRFPRGSLYRGGDRPSCSADRIRRAGIAACPKAAIVGRGRVRADADTVPTTARITVVNGGGTRVLFFTEMENPAIVQVPVEGRVRRTSGRWAYELMVDIPGELQVVGGIPIFVRDLRVTAGRGDWLAVSRPPTAIGVTTVLGPPRG